MTDSSAYVIEVRDATAGIVVREGRGYRFFAAQAPFQSLEGRIFGDPRKAEHAAQRLIETKRQRYPH